MSPPLTRRAYAAQRSFGGVEQMKERARDQRRLPYWKISSAILGLACGSCAKSRFHRRGRAHAGARHRFMPTAILSVVNTVLLRPLDYFESDRIVMIRELTPPPSLKESVVSPRNYLDWAKQSSSFASIAAFANDSVNFTGGSEPRQLSATKVTAGYFDVYGLPLAVGRRFLPAEDSPGGGHSRDLERPFGSRPLAATGMS